MNQTNQSESVRINEIVLPGDRYFPEGVAAASNGTIFVGSMYEGCIMRAQAGKPQAEPFIDAGVNGLVSVLGLWVDEAGNMLWACSSDYGNCRLTGRAPVGVRAFDLGTGAAKGGFDVPGGGFANDLTIDSKGNLYVTDSWTPRILRLAAGGVGLEEWINDPFFGVEQWSLNGIDYDRFSHSIYTVNQRQGRLFKIDIQADGSAGSVTEINCSLELRRPDGLKVIGTNLLATAEAGGGGVAVMRVHGNQAEVRRVPAGLDGPSTFAYHQGSAWVVETQSDHFWDPANAGPNADPPFRIVEVPIHKAVAELM